MREIQSNSTYDRLAAELWNVEYADITDPFDRLCACTDRIRSAIEVGRIGESDESRILDALERHLPARRTSTVGGRYFGDTYGEIEDRYRRQAFHTYYYRLFATESDPNFRFVKALITSCRPVRDPRKVVRWHRDQVRTRLRQRKRGGK